MQLYLINPQSVAGPKEKWVVDVGVWVIFIAGFPLFDCLPSRKQHLRKYLFTYLKITKKKTATNTSMYTEWGKKNLQLLRYLISLIIQSF